MCGIAGIISKSGKPVDPILLKRMCDIQAHRGPDDAGYVFFNPGFRSDGRGNSYCRFTEPEFHRINQHIAPFGGSHFSEKMSGYSPLVGMGHRRLSIIDLSSAAHQPLSSLDKRYWISYNGEVFNFPTMREELQTKGYNFTSKSDTEVLLHMWQEHADGCLEAFNGMFALSIYDTIENVVVLARDRYGIKPLYYAENADFFLYSSELKAILATGLIRAEIDPESLCEYMTFQNIYTDGTLFSGVKLLEPGQALGVRPGAGEGIKLWRFHKGFPSVDPSLNDSQPLEEEIAAAFLESVKKQLISDVDVGAYLSGGMDSGSIVAIAGKRIPRLHTFTCGFDLTNVDGIEQGFDERAQSEALSYLLQTEHYEVVLHSGDMPAAMDKLSWHVDDPRVGMCHQNWYASKLAGKFVKVCLAGAGGDELFAGYPWRYLEGMASSLKESDDKWFRYWHRLLPHDELPGLFMPEIRSGLAKTRSSFDAVMSAAPEAHKSLSLIDTLLQRMLFFELRTFMQGVLLIDDKIGMAHRLEERVPFLDNDLVNLAFRIPPSLKLDISKLSNPSGDRFKADEGKLILRRAMRKFLPDLYTKQPKQGFSSPDGNWYRGESMKYIKSILFDKQALERPWFDQSFVKQRLEEHFNGQRNHRLLIWSLLSVEWLQRHFIDQQSTVTQSEI